MNKGAPAGRVTVKLEQLLARRSAAPRSAAEAAFRRGRTSAIDPSTATPQFPIAFDFRARSRDARESRRIAGMPSGINL